VLHLKNVDSVPLRFIKAFLVLEEQIHALYKDKKTRKKFSKKQSTDFMYCRNKYIQNWRKKYDSKIRLYLENPESSEDDDILSIGSDDFLDDADDLDFAEDDDTTTTANNNNNNNNNNKGKNRKDAFTAVTKKKHRKNKKDKKKKEPEKVKIVWNENLIEKKLAEIIDKRGYKGAQYDEIISTLNHFVKISKDIKNQVRTIFVLISAQFDATRSTHNYITTHAWKAAYKNIVHLFKIIRENPKIKICELRDTDEEEDGEEVAKKQADGIYVLGNIYTFISCLQAELVKSLQHMDPHKHEFVSRLKDECLLMDVAERAYEYYQSKKNVDMETRMAHIIIEHIYHRTAEDHKKLVAKQRRLAFENRKKTYIKSLPKSKQKLKASNNNKNAKTTADKTEVVKTEESLSSSAASQSSSSEAKELEEPGHNFTYTAKKIITADLPSLITQLCGQVFKNGSIQSKTSCMLFYIYHKSMIDQFEEAKELLLMSHLQENIHGADVKTRILYNRTLAQLGLCAFRAGNYRVSMHSLQEICTNQRNQERELLAQGFTANRNEKPEVQRMERSRLIPFHMHINLDMLEGIHLICAMLFEAVNFAKFPFSAKQHIISKTFQKYIIDYYDKQTFRGPPENTRDHINAASRALIQGDWETCMHFLTKMSIWEVFRNPKEALAKLRLKVLEQALKCYLLSFKKCYKSISVVQLHSMFRLPKQKIVAVISKMLIWDDIPGSYWNNDRTVLYCDNKSERHASRLQLLSLTFAEKNQDFAEYVDKLQETIHKAEMSAPKRVTV